ncbi:hypothetical protein [Hymenobacter canadensis]|uniref:Uncharacterized protein n=1 Tax=Hymenobacter canadensis TaxID=2999067 RepID=A0ABY7LN25_9BACT|nr:hypothetical protein [Hymenobacter canadensis]WBA41833.1 hypothetical protein O3303_18740 [Hymenobacter canadensis]
MTISHRAADVPAATATQPVKVARIACCCKLSDLLPLVQQLHRETVRPAAKSRQSEAA